MASFVESDNAGTDLVDKGEEMLMDAMERIKEWTAESEADEVTRAKLEALVRVIDDSKNHSSKAVRDFIANNEEALKKARSKIEEIGESLGVKVPENISDNIERLREVLMGEDDASKERAKRARALMADGQAYVSELLQSEEAKHLETEGKSMLEDLQGMEETKRIQQAMSQVIMTSLGTEAQEDLSIGTFKDFVLNTVTPEKVAEKIHSASESLAKADLEAAVKESIDNDKSGILKQITGGQDGGQNADSDSAGTSVDGGGNDTLAEAKSRAEDVLQKLGHGGIEGAVETAKSVTTKASETLSKDLDKAEAAKITDASLETGVDYLKDLQSSGQGQQLLRSTISFLQNDMSRGLVKDIVKSLGSADTVELGKKAVTDEDARNKFLDRIKVSGTELFSKSLPGIQIPPISGLRDNVAYTIDGLDLSGFNINPDSFDFQSFDMHSEGSNGEIFQFACSNMSAKVDALSWSYRQEYFPYLAGQGLADCTIEGLELKLSFKLVRRKLDLDSSKSEVCKDGNNGDGADLPIHLVLAKKEMSVEKLELSTRGATITWVYNMLLALFSEVVRDYIISSILTSLEDATDVWLERLNEANQSMHLPLILRSVFNVPVDRLEIVGPKEKQTEDIVLVESSSSSSMKTYDVEFQEPGPLGMRIGISAVGNAETTEDLGEHNTDNKPKSVVIKFIKNSDGSLSLAEKSGKINLGDAPVGLNGKSLLGMSTNAIISTIREANSARPLRITFQRYSDDSSQRKQAVIEQVFGPGPLGLELTANSNIGGHVPRGAMIRRFKPLRDGKAGPAERCGVLKPSMILASCNGTELLGWEFQKIMTLLKTARRPIVLRFRHDPDVRVTFHRNGPLGLRLAVFQELAIVTGFVQQSGPAERDGRIKPGHVLHCIAGRPVTTAASSGALRHDVPYKENIDAIRRAHRPLVLRFGPNTDKMDMASKGGKMDLAKAESSVSPNRAICETLPWCDVTFSNGPLGITFCDLPDGRTGVLRLPKLDGLAKMKGDIIRQGMAIISVNGRSLEGLELPEVIKFLREASSPRELTFRDVELYNMIRKSAETKDSASGDP